LPNQKVYRKCASWQLAQGHIGVVVEVTAMIGHHFFGEDESWGSHPKLKFDLRECAAEAFDITWQKGEYGIAAALVFQFGEDACLDPKLLRERATGLTKEEGDDESVNAKLGELVEERKTQIRTAAELAKTTGKSISFDYKPRFAPKL